MGIQCVILAGGLATRMRPITEKIPKSLIPILNERPFVGYQLAWLEKTGVTDIVFSIGYKGEMIRDFIGDGSRWNLRVTYVDEGDALRGTAGALRKALDDGVLKSEFLVTYGDSFLPIEFGNIFENFRASNSKAMMTIFRNYDKFDASNACFDCGKITLYDKWAKVKPHTMKYIDYGLSMFSCDIIRENIDPSMKADLADLFNRLSVLGQLDGYEVYKRFYEIGSLAGLEDFRTFALANGLAN